MQRVLTIITLLLLPAVLLGARIDEDTGSDTSIEWNHVVIHEGIAFHNSQIGSIAASPATMNYAITTPSAAKEVHFSFVAASTGQATCLLYEGMTVSGGTTFTKLNRKRGSSVASSVSAQVKAAVLGTGARVGTIIRSEVIGAGRTAGTGAAVNEWVLAPATKYVLVLRNAETSAKDLSLRINWYELTE